MKGKRILASFLSLVMVLGLFAAFPQLVMEKADAAALTNLALKATYRGADGTATNGTGSYGDGASWNAYHTGKLNNGTISTTAATTTSDSIEMSIGDITALVKGTLTLYFKLDSAASVSQVNVLATRRDNAYRGYPDTVRVYVGNSEGDVSTTTLLGTVAESAATAYSSSTYVKQYSVSGTAKTGSFVIVQMDITATNASTTAGDGVIVLNEVQIMGTSLNEAGLANIAKLSTYKAASNCEDNGDVTWGEADWNTAYHSGKLNDGLFSTTYTPSASDTVKETTNTELWLTDFVAGKAYVYFKLPANYTVSQVNVYTNIRNGSANRGYPTEVNVYVGSSETDISNKTLLGDSSYSTFRSSVRNYSTKGLKSGNYVILELGVDATQVVLALTEVEIFGVQSSGTSLNAARGATYKAASNCEDNYDGTWGDLNWNEYHAGKLNDGLFSTTYTPAGTDTVKETTNVEFWLTDFVSGKAYIYFKLPTELLVTQVNLYTNIRNGSANRGYPTEVNIYVGNSEGATSSDALLGASSYSAYNTSVRKYTTAGSRLGEYVILELGVDATQVVLALTEVEIIATDVSNAVLTAPVINSNTGMATYTVPTVSWAAVPNATSYDVYLNGTLAVADTTALSYTPTGLSPFNLYNKGTNRAYDEIYVVAKADGYTSATSNTFSFRYVEKPTDRNGNPVTSADFILDAGHGGTDPGAMYGTREEADDNLNMTLAVGELLEEAGFTVAYTRLTDVFDSPAVKSAKCEAGDFGYYLCFHRNSATSVATGTEYLYRSGDTASLNLATAMEAEFVSDAIWTNRGEVARDDLTILNNNTVPSVLLELGFINNDADNTTYDTYFAETAQAIARGAIKYAGYTVGATGYLDSPIGSAFNGSDAITGSVTVGNVGDTAVLNIRGWLLNSSGVNAVQYSVDGGEWQALTLFDRSGELGGYTYKSKLNSGYSTSISTSGWSVGNHTVVVRGVSSWDSTTKYANTVNIASLTVNVEDITAKTFTVTFLGKDGQVLSTQSVQYAQSATAPEAPVIEGYTFKGWDKAFDNVSADLTINAVYEILTYTVTFIGNDGTVISTQTVNYGASATAPEAPAVEGLYFHGWDKAFDNIKEDTTVTAKYSAYIVDTKFDTAMNATYGSFDTDGDGVNDFYGIAVDIFVTNIDTGYGYGIHGFDGYLYFDEDALTPLFVTDAELNGSSGVENPKVLVKWPSYTVKVPGSTYTYEMMAIEGVSTPYAYVNADGTLTNTDPNNPSQGFTMGRGYIRINYMLDMEKYAPFVESGIGCTTQDNVQFRYYFKVNDGSLDVGESFFFQVPDNPEATTTSAAPLKAPYYTGASDNTSMKAGFGKGSDYTLTIEQKPEYTVNFIVDGEIVDTQTVVEGGAAVAPEAPVVEGYTFTGWDVAFDNVTSDLTVTAQYEQIMVTVTFEAGVGGTLSGTTSVPVAYGTDLSTVTFPTATADEGYEFDAWSATSGIITVDTTVTASFKEVVIETPADFFTFADGVDSTNIVVSTTTNYIYFKAGGYTADAFKALFADENITITKANGTTAVTGSTSYVGTTCLATSTINGQSETREIIVFGDTNGDGKVNGTDYGQVKNCAMGRITLTGAKRVAANIAKPAVDTIDGSDYAQVKNFSMGRTKKFNVTVS